MVEKNMVRIYSPKEMEEYCKQNIDKCKMEPIVREAFYYGLIEPHVAFIHLRIAQMAEGKDKISCSQIAQETSHSNSSISQYIKNPLKGILPKVFVQLFLLKNLKTWLDLCECDKPNEALTKYINEHRSMKITNGEKEGLCEADYTLNSKTEFTKDACRKMYDDLVRRRKRDWVESNGCAVISAEVIENAETVKVHIKWREKRECETIGKEHILECYKNEMVHKVVLEILLIFGGLTSGPFGRTRVYLYDVGNRKVNLAMEYVALIKDRVFLL